MLSKLFVKHFNLPIKSKFGWVIFDERELHGWQGTGSTGSVSFTLSILKENLLHGQEYVS